MRVLFDVNVPEPLRFYLTDHQVAAAAELGWIRLKNGLLLDAAEGAGFNVMITADQNIQYQQNLTGRKIALVVLGSNLWPFVRRHVAEIISAVNAAQSGDYFFIEVPLPPRPKRSQT